MNPELSIPVIWAEGGDSPLAGRLDVFADRLHFDGGVRDRRQSRDLHYDEIVSARMGRKNGERIKGRASVVLGLAAGGTLSFVGFNGPGTLAEILHRVEARI